MNGKPWVDPGRCRTRYVKAAYPYEPGKFNVFMVATGVRSWQFAGGHHHRSELHATTISMPKTGTNTMFQLEIVIRDQDRTNPAKYLEVPFPALH